jgi:hypothetical protein
MWRVAQALNFSVSQMILDEADSNTFTSSLLVRCLLRPKVTANYLLSVFALLFALIVLAFATRMAVIYQFAGEWRSVRTLPRRCA